MRKTTKFLVTAAVVVLCAAALLAARQRVSTTVPTPRSPSVQTQAAATPPVPLGAGTPSQAVTLSASDEANTISSLPPDATSVPDAALLKLSTMVNLPNAEERRIDKEQWNRALPIAQKLVQGPCDCEQRNWLNQFIRMGNDALTEDHEDYFRLAAVMRKTARNDQQLVSDPAFFAR